MKKKKILEVLDFLDGFSDAQNLSEMNECISRVIRFVNKEYEDVKVPKAAKESKKIQFKDLLLTDEALQLQAFSVFSDGACRGNPGVGSYGIVAQSPDGEVIFTASEYFELTTNNRMELLGAIKGLELTLRHLANLKMSQNTAVILYTDSRYVVDGLEKWLPNWKARGWKKADNKEPENIDLWKNFDFITSKFKNLKLRWVKGHSGHPQNELCDQLANEELDRNQ